MFSSCGILPDATNSASCRSLSRMAMGETFAMCARVSAGRAQTRHTVRGSLREVEHSAEHILSKRVD
eukprot:6175564-Prymnesium_polylepis.1